MYLPWDASPAQAPAGSRFSILGFCQIPGFFGTGFTLILIPGKKSGIFLGFLFLLCVLVKKNYQEALPVLAFLVLGLSSRFQCQAVRVSEHFQLQTILFHPGGCLICWELSSKWRKKFCMLTALQYICKKIFSSRKSVGWLIAVGKIDLSVEAVQLIRVIRE